MMNRRAFIRSAAQRCGRLRRVRSTGERMRRIGVLMNVAAVQLIAGLCFWLITEEPMNIHKTFRHWSGKSFTSAALGLFGVAAIAMSAESTANAQGAYPTRSIKLVV